MILEWELESKLLEWAGFRWVSGDEDEEFLQKYHSEDYIYPDGLQYDERPDLTSLDFCFKWLVPRFVSPVITFATHKAGCNCTVIIDIDHRVEAFADNPSLALCRAIGKWI